MNLREDLGAEPQLRRIETRTYESVYLMSHELHNVTVSDIEALPWAIAGVARVRATSFGLEIRIGSFAGRIDIPGVAVINIHELVPGTAEACVELATSGWRTGEQRSSKSRPYLSPMAAVARQFVREATDLTIMGPRKDYQTEFADLSRPRGSIRVGSTIALRNRGKFDRASCRYRRLTEDIALNRVLLACSRISEALLLSNEDPDLYLARQLQRRLAACGHFSLRDLDTAFRDHRGPREEEVLRIGETLLMGVPRAEVDLEDSHNFAAWINLDLVFEQAVRSILQRTSEFTVTPGRVERRYVLRAPEVITDAVRVKRANPDICMRRSGFTVIADAKYRRSGLHVDEASLYQLIAHADAFGADRAALIVPAIDSEAGIYELGLDPNDRRVDVVVVDPSSQGSMIEVLLMWQQECTPQGTRS